MDVFLLAQVIGLLGYGLYIAGPYKGERKTVLKMDMQASAILIVQWALLAQPLMIINNLLGICSTLLVLRHKDSDDNSYKRWLCAFYPVILLSFLPFWTGEIIDFMALSAALCMLSARGASNMLSFRLWALSGGLFLMCAGAIAMSLPALIFNGLFVFGHLQKLCIPLIMRNYSQVVAA